MPHPGCEPRTPPAVFSPCSASVPRIHRTYLGRQPRRKRGAQAPSAGRWPLGLGGSPCHLRAVRSASGAEAELRKRGGSLGSREQTHAAELETSGRVSEVRSAGEPASESSQRRRCLLSTPAPQRPQEAAGGTASRGPREGLPLICIIGPASVPARQLHSLSTSKPFLLSRVPLS